MRITLATYIQRSAICYADITLDTTLDEHCTLIARQYKLQDLTVHGLIANMEIILRTRRDLAHLRCAIWVSLTAVDTPLSHSALMAYNALYQTMLTIWDELDDGKLGY